MDKFRDNNTNLTFKIKIYIYNGIHRETYMYRKDRFLNINTVFYMILSLKYTFF